MFGLVDCNNFYVSCERVFQPRLEGRPVVILSNNDGCIISRSAEAKALGLKMGEPYFQVKEQLQREQVQVFSSNYTLYGDMSRRVMHYLGASVPGVEIYSIDEAFLDLGGLKGRISRHQPPRFPPPLQPFHRAVTVHHRHHDVPVVGLQVLVHRQQVAGVNLGPAHRLA